jgi:DNA excision repair protein ERCC-4
VIIYDHREHRSGIPEQLAARGFDVRPDNLPAGDYILSDRLVVERKSGSDLAASIKDRRVFEQVDRLKAAYPAVVLLVEGRPIHISEASWKGALGRVLAAGVGVLQTADALDSADWIARLARQADAPPSGARGAGRVRREPEAVDILGCLPGISTVNAGRLLAHFGSLQAVTAASEPELRAVRGIGPVKAAELARLFGGGRRSPRGRTSPG